MNQQNNNPQNNQQPTDKFSLGQVLVFDKPLKWTSFDLVNKVRYMLKTNLGIKKIKVGHAGTLDPLATGVLIVCTGKKTKEITTFQDHDKEYIATIQLGSTTPSFDLETQPENFVDTTNISEQMVQDCLKSFLGNQIQYPPVYSAKKIDGKPAYISAHKGRGDEVKMRPNQIEITELQIIEWNDLNKCFKLRVACSKGTYIRSLANDIGKKLGVGAHLAGLRRTRIGEINLNSAILIEDFEKSLKSYQQ
ncbi:MAG: tRNA pseudouridine(55) synthase TruB [Bacteroidales bacterium]|nr:tRNA pseudouridine(55) synthase TruB [Bacteroidales bacterium]